MHEKFVFIWEETWLLYRISKCKVHIQALLKHVTSQKYQYPTKESAKLLNTYYKIICWEWLIYQVSLCLVLILKCETFAKSCYMQEITCVFLILSITWFLRNFQSVLSEVVQIPETYKKLFFSLTVNTIFLICYIRIQCKERDIF